MKKAFTLIELMITISIIAILTSIAIPVYSRVILKMRSDEAKAVIQSIVFAQERYKQENGDFYPKSNTDAIPSDSTVKNEKSIVKALKINLSKSNNFNYTIEDLSGNEDGNFTIKAILRLPHLNISDICTNETIGTLCKQEGTINEESWLSQWNRAETNHFLEFRYPSQLNNDFTEGGVSYENLHTGD